MGEYCVSISSTTRLYRTRRGSTSPKYQSVSASTSENVSSSAPTVVLVLTTIAAEADGPAFARTLVDEQLAACVNVLPAMTSVYRWKGQVESDREQQIVIKTTRDRLGALEKRVKELHAYELPEFVVIAADEGSAAYLGWVAESVTSAGGE
jgi:periplasmic divalent cation tolerance protein